MSKKFNLSEKIFDGANTEGWHKGIKIEDVKEFIKRLKNKLPKGKVVVMDFREEIDKLAGEKLI